jgi:aminoglycoside/choline kinase family phosphotransferase
LPLLDAHAWCSFGAEVMTHPPISDPLELADWCRSEPVTGDASPRRYRRLHKTDGQTAILVEYPEPIRHQLVADLEVFSWCRRRGLRVPALLAEDAGAGRALLEDLGSTDAEAAFTATPHDLRPALFERLLGPLEILATCRPDDLPPWNPPLDRTRLRWELAGFELWYVRHYRSLPPSPELGRWLEELAVKVASHPVRVCHRDYHFNNLLIRNDDSVGVIDIQDILVGPDTYDIVSLVADRAAARLISAAERSTALATWARRTGAEPGWQDRVAAVEIQRGLKVLGTFARFTLAGRTDYRRWLTDLAGNLTTLVTAAGAPPEISAFLLD